MIALAVAFLLLQGATGPRAPHWPTRRNATASPILRLGTTSRHRARNPGLAFVIGHGPP